MSHPNGVTFSKSGCFCIAVSEGAEGLNLRQILYEYWRGGAESKTHASEVMVICRGIHCPSNPNGCVNCKRT